MIKKQAIGNKLYIISGTKQATMGQIAIGLGQKGHSLGQNSPRFSYSIALYYYLSLSSLYIREVYKMNIVLREGYRDCRILSQGRKLVKKFGPSKKLYNMDKKQLFFIINGVYWIKHGLFCPKVLKKRLGQRI